MGDGSKFSPDMEAGQEDGRLMRYQLEYRLVPPGGAPSSETGTACFLEETLEIRGDSGRIMSIPVREIASFEAGDYRIGLNLQSGVFLELYYLGRYFSDFADKLTDVRNSVIKKDLLMHEKLLFTAEDVQYRYMEKAGGEGQAETCDVQVTETALIIAEPEVNHLRVPLSYVKEIVDEDYSLHVLAETGDRIVLSMLGRQREPLLLNMEKAIKNLEVKARELCRDLFPDAGGALPERLAVLFRDGRAVSRKTLDGLAPGMWERMEERLEAFGIRKSYDFLKRFNDTGYGAIGFKRGLMGDLTGEYVWLLIPVRGNRGRMIALEAGSDGGTGGKATYFFRVPDGYDDGDSLEEYIQLLNYNLLVINFRREPIYLREEMLEKPAYKHYRYAIEKLPSLRFLRAWFSGRVAHSSEEAWRGKLTSL
ncbi:MAG TPA: hypothetical protein PK369_08300 [Thermoclostridium sp.]|nr:hypothetical protein [Thermoclostridium sp.]HPU44850.1 hypothetical protein [Thermoclostridium sp.]